MAQMSIQIFLQIFFFCKTFFSFAEKVYNLITVVGPEVVTLIQEIITVIQGGTTVTLAEVKALAQKLGLNLSNAIFADLVALAQLIYTIAAQYGPEVWALVQKIITDLTPKP